MRTADSKMLSTFHQQTINELQAIHGSRRIEATNLEENIHSGKNEDSDSLDSLAFSDEPMYPTDMQAYLVHYKTNTNFQSPPTCDRESNSSEIINQEQNNFDEPLPNIFKRYSDIVEVSEISNDKEEIIKTTSFDRKTNKSSSSSLFYDSLDTGNSDNIVAASGNGNETFRLEDDGHSSLRFLKNPSNETISISSISENSVDHIVQGHRQYLRNHSLGYISINSNGRFISYICIQVVELSSMMF